MSEPTKCPKCSSTKVRFNKNDDKIEHLEIWICQSCWREFTYMPNRKGKLEE